MIDQYQKLQPVREDVIALLRHEMNEWLKEAKPGERDRNSEILFHVSELQSIITKLQPQSEGNGFKAPSFS
jgi:hypothetical protein